MQWNPVAWWVRRVRWLRGLSSPRVVLGWFGYDKKTRVGCYRTAFAVKETSLFILYTHKVNKNEIEKNRWYYIYVCMYVFMCIHTYIFMFYECLCITIIVERQTITLCKPSLLKIWIVNLFQPVVGALTLRGWNFPVKNACEEKCTHSMNSLDRYLLLWHQKGHAHKTQQASQLHHKPLDS